VSIKPPSDIVLDVARAADPVKAAAATERLSRLSGDGADDAGFADVLGAVQSQSADLADLRTRMAVAGAGRASAMPNVDAGAKAYKGLETLVLQNLVQTMLPNDAEEIFGHGSAGEIWKSMLAQQLAKELSRKVDLHIASKVAALHPPTGSGAEHAKAPAPAQGSFRIRPPHGPNL
jgi:Rod binding domain-containing protein